MADSRISLIYVFLFFLAFSVYGIKSCVAVSEEAAVAIERAEAVLISSYRVVLDAEGAGANVSELVIRLNGAGELLAEAQVSYRVEDFEEAVLLAELCSEVGENVLDEAARLKSLAAVQGIQRFRWTVTVTIFGVAVVACLSLSAWLIFKRYYIRRVLSMKPEVVSDEP